MELALLESVNVQIVQLAERGMKGRPLQSKTWDPVNINGLAMQGSSHDVVLRGLVDRIELRLTCSRGVRGAEGFADRLRARHSRCSEHTVFLSLSQLLFLLGFSLFARCCQEREDAE